MNTLELTKKELGYLLIVATLLPIMSFFLGFYLSESTSSVVSKELKKPVISKIENLTVKSNLNLESTSSIDEPLIQEPIIESTLHEQLNIGTRNDGDELLLLNTHYDVQAGVFSNIRNATKYQYRLIDKGIDTQVIFDAAPVEQPLYRVVLGTFETKYLAIQYLLSIEQNHGLDLYIKEIDNKNNFKITSL